MKNSFENSVQNTQNIPESDQEADFEKAEAQIEKSADYDITVFEKLNNAFLEHEKQRFGLENNQELNAEIAAVQEKYRSEKKKVKSGFLRKLKKIGKFTIKGIIALAITAHFTQKEFPDYLSKETEKEEKHVTWNESTRAELEKLSNEYTLAMKTDSVYAQMPDSVFKNRFMNFVKTWGSDITIVHPGDDMSVGDKMNEIIFEDVLRQQHDKSHYDNGTIFYQRKHLDSTTYSQSDFDKNSSFEDFCAEFSHHINKDWTLRRSFAYTEDLVRKGFDQSQMYEDAYSSEYQAHVITQDAIGKYLIPDNHDLNVDFVDIYNTEQEYYREFRKTKSYEGSKQVDGFVFTLLSLRNIEDVYSKKENIFKNVESLRNTIETLNTDDETKGKISEIITWAYNLDNLNQNLEQMVSDTREVIQIAEKLKTNDLPTSSSTLEEVYIENLLAKNPDDKTTHYFEGVNPEKAKTIRNIVHAYQALKP